MQNAKGKSYKKEIIRTDPVIVTWTRVAPKAKVYQTNDDARTICEMVWGDRSPTGICVQEMSADQIRSGQFNISELEKRLGY
jgi:hypothetical protein